MFCGYLSVWQQRNSLHQLSRWFGLRCQCERADRVQCWQLQRLHGWYVSGLVHRVSGWLSMLDRCNNAHCMRSGSVYGE